MVSVGVLTWRRLDDVSDLTTSGCGAATGGSIPGGAVGDCRSGDVDLVCRAGGGVKIDRSRGRRMAVGRRTGVRPGPALPVAPVAVGGPSGESGTPTSAGSAARGETAGPVAAAAAAAAAAWAPAAAAPGMGSGSVPAVSAAYPAPPALCWLSLDMVQEERLGRIEPRIGSIHSLGSATM